MANSRDNRQMKPMLASLACVVLIIAGRATAAVAQPLSTGVRVGASADPDQFYFGGHVETAALVDRIHFRPNAEIGIGDGVTLVALNFELAYKFRSSKPWNAYAFAGPALNIVKVHDDSSAGGGFSIGLGIEHREGLFGEIKVGFIDSPDFKIGIGYRFH
jgi:hypothetical protein